MADLTVKVLAVIAEKMEITSMECANILLVDHQKIIGAVKSISSHDQVISTRPVTLTTFALTQEGKDMVLNGSHEARVHSAVPNDGIDKKKLMELVGPCGKIGFSKAMGNGWIHIDKCSGDRVHRTIESISDEVQSLLEKIQRGGELQAPDKSKMNDLKKRKLIQEIQVKGFSITKGPAFALELEKQETDLTSDLLGSGAWKSSSFKTYNFDAMGIQPERGHLHTLMKVRAEFRQIFLEMGFTEMPTNRFVESSFWNFDALFQPQQHPARDAHDTFFISDPMESEEFPADYAEIVRRTHSVGGFDSIGYNYDWQFAEAKKNLLRTHTTAVSARMLHKVAKMRFEACKFFSIDRVFRNETLDATHLAEFHQIEGVVVDKKLTLGHLMGVIRAFFDKLGIEKIRFKAAYNPYTEPSMEIFSFHDGLNKWVEIGNSGMFRPEMLRPMGLPDDVRVLGFGLSLERPTMIKYGIDNIRDLVGHRVDLRMVNDNPICRLEKVSTR